MGSFRFGRSLGKAVLSTLLLSALAACGGGGSSGGNDNNNGGSGNGGGGSTTPPPAPTKSRLTLTGTVTDAPIPGAVVTATIGNETFTATADANGNYRLELSVEEGATGGFVTLQARGTGAQSYIDFTSLLGTFAALKTQAGSDEILANSENFATQITNVSTALAVLLQQANGGQPVASQSSIDTLTPTLNAQQLLDVAAAIKLLVDEPDDYPMPSGQTSLATLLADGARREQLVRDLYDQNPTTFIAAQNAIVADPTLTQPLTAATVPPTVTAVLLNNDSSAFYDYKDRALAYSFNSNGTGTASSGSWHRNMTWSLSGTSIEIAYEQPLEIGGWESRACPQDGTGYEPADYGVSYRTQGAKLTFINEHVLAITESRDILARDCGDVPDAPEIVTLARTILDDQGFQPFDIDDLRDSTRILWVYSDAFDDHYVFPNVMPDLARLNADGTGTTATYGQQFSWSLDASGRVLTVTFADNISAKVRLIRELDAVATDVLYEFTLPDGRRVDARPSLRAEPQQQLAFSPTNVPGRHYVFGINDPPFAAGSKGARLRFDANGFGSRETEIIDQDGTITVLDSTSPNKARYGFFWNIDGGDLVLQYTSNDAGERNCDLIFSSPCYLVEDARIQLLASEGTRTYWFESWRTGLPYLHQGAAPHTNLRYYDYEPFGATSVASAMRRNSHIARGAYHKFGN